MKRYLGDGVYVDFDGFQIVLTTEDGLRATNTIYLEPEVVNALFRFAQQVGEPVMWDSSNSVPPNIEAQARAALTAGGKP